MSFTIYENKNNKFFGLISWSEYYFWNRDTTITVDLFLPILPQWLFHGIGYFIKKSFILLPVLQNCLVGF